MNVKVTMRKKKSVLLAWCDRLLGFPKTEILPWLAAQKMDLHVSGGLLFIKYGSFKLCLWSVV